MFSRCGLIVCVLTVFSAIIWAEDINVPSQRGSIQSAINAANDGDTVTVAPGVYRENIRLNGKDITITSQNPNDALMVSETIIDGGGRDSTVLFNGNESEACRLIGLSITGGYAERGGGVYGTGCDVRWCEFNRQLYHFGQYCI